MLSDPERRTVQELESVLLSDPVFARAVLPVTRSLRALSAAVVVGIAADGGSGPALAWAAAEAARLDRPLRIVHAIPAPPALDPYGIVPALDEASACRAAAARLLDAALAEVPSLAPGVRASGTVVRGSPRRALLAASRDASLLVLGSRRRGRSLRTGPVGAPLHRRVACSARCPVTVVPAEEGTGPPDRAPRVVVGVDGSPHSEAAVGFAFRAAARRGAALTAVHAWCADHPADLEGVAAPPATTEAAAYALVDEAVGRWRELCPDVPVSAEVVHRDPVSALLAGSAGAALLVVGSRGRRGVLRGLSRSVGGAVLDGAAGPVALVPRGVPQSAPQAARWAAR